MPSGCWTSSVPWTSCWERRVEDGAGSVVFQIFADERKVFDSGVMRGKQPAKKVSVPLDGVEELLLLVTDAGDGINCDHADWADAQLLGNP